MAMDASEIEQLIKARLPDAVISIQDTAGDRDHYAATIVSEAFRGKSRVQQHRKDLHLIIEAAARSGHTLPLAATHFPSRIDKKIPAN